MLCSETIGADQLRICFRSSFVYKKHFTYLADSYANLANNYTGDNCKQGNYTQDKCTPDIGTSRLRMNY